MPAGALTIKILGDASGFQKTLGQTEKQVEGFGGKTAQMGKIIGGALAGAAVVNFGKDAVKSFTEAAQAQSQLNNALANNPATVGVTAKAFEDYNKTLAKKTLVDDDALASGQAVLAGFGLTEDQLKKMTPVLADYAAKTGKDIPSAAEDLGKAILGQGKALKAIGVDFKNTGTSGGNLAEIMGTVGPKVAGAAEAQLKAAGPGAQMKKSMDELSETVGGLLVPALSKLSDIAVGVVDFFTALPGPAKALVGVLAALAGAVYAIVAAQKAWVAIQTALNVVMALNPIVAVVAAVVALGAALVIAYQKVGWFHDAVNAVFNWLKDNWPLVLGILTGPIGLAVVAIVKHWDTIKAGFTAVKDWIGEKVGDIVGFFTGLPGRIGDVATTLFDGIKDAFAGMLNWLIEQWNKLDLKVPDIPGLPRRGEDLFPDITPIGKDTAPAPLAAAPGGLLSGAGGPVTNNSVTVNVSGPAADPNAIARAVMWNLQ